MSNLVERFREESNMIVWNNNVKYFRQVLGESIVDYGVCFDVEIVKTYPLSEPMNNLQKTHVYIKAKSRDLQTKLPPLTRN